MKLFDYLKAITSQKLELDFNDHEISKEYEPFIINRYVSMCELYIPIANAINRFTVPKAIHYRFYLNALPKRQVYLEYIKPDKNVDDDTAIDYIAMYFDCGMKEARHYKTILSKDQIKEIIDIYRYGNNKIVEA